MLLNSFTDTEYYRANPDSVSVQDLPLTFTISGIYLVSITANVLALRRVLTQKLGKPQETAAQKCRFCVGNKQDGEK
jgi:hypothetical protein